MHMVDALLSPAVGGVMCAASLAADMYAVKAINKEELSEKKIPIMGVMGAFVFAAQMINFTIPMTGASGHIIGAILLAAVVGELPALLVTTAVIVIQCLFFADGGLLALGCNIINMGVVPCLIVFPYIFKPIVMKGMTLKRISVASILSSVIAVSLGAFCVVLETTISGISELPFSTFLLLMQPIHLVIGIVEGVVTASILCFVYRMRPEVMDTAIERAPLQSGIKIKSLLIVLIVITLLTGGLLSVIASSNPDGLEWSIEKTASGEAVETNYPFIEGTQKIQQSISPMPDYDSQTVNDASGPSVAAIIGGSLTFIVACLCPLIVSFFKKRKRLEVE
ncbi:MAG: energy-coupling factor ABC transporter permease [Oscillospiraceae bacterium]|nr:energy-coupling factor ABC transporter permease [Oscillospiraceae bacterium]